MKLAAAAAAAAVVLASGATAPAEPTARVPRLGHVVVVVFENKEARDVLGSGEAPTFDRLARRYASLTRYYGVTHPSLPNYLALVSGSTHGIRSDCTDCSVGGASLADTLERAGKTWKAYAEGIPRPGYTGAESGRYVKKHVPFLYFRRVTSSPDRRARVVPLRRLTVDLRRRTLPSFSLVVPNLCNGMHDCPVATGDRWLARFLPPLLRSRPLRDGVVFVVFDEGRSDAGGGGRVAALALGPRVRPGASDDARANHYSLLRTVEDALGVRRLGRSAKARAFTSIWR